MPSQAKLIKPSHVKYPQVVLGFKETPLGKFAMDFGLWYEQYPRPRSP